MTTYNTENPRYMQFCSLLAEWLELTRRGPQDSNGVTDKAYHRRVRELEDELNTRSPYRTD